MAGLQFLPLWVTDHLTDVPGCSPQIRVFVSSLCTPFCLRSPWLLWHSAPRYSSSQPNSPFLFTSISSQILQPHLVLSFYHIFSYTTPKITFPEFSKKGTCGEKGKVVGMMGCISTEDKSSRTDENSKRMTQTRKEKGFQRIKRIKKMLCMCPLYRVTQILSRKINIVKFLYVV